LNTGSDERFDRLTRIAVRLFDVPIALVTLIDEERQYFKSLCGVELQPINKMVSFCNWILKTGQPLVIEDTLMNPNFLKILWLPAILLYVFMQDIRCVYPAEI
jgi:GAF domain-containing protein